MVGLTFEEWCKAVNEWVLAKVGVGREDLPDVDYRGMYDMGFSPARAGREAVRNAKES